MYIKYTTRDPVILLTVEKSKHRNLDFGLFLSFHTCITQKLNIVYEQSANQTTALLSEIFLFMVRAGCELRPASFASKHASQSLSDMPFCACLHAQLEKERSYEDVLPIERLLYYQRFLFFQLGLYDKYDWQVMDPNTFHNHFPI